MTVQSTRDIPNIIMNHIRACELDVESDMLTNIHAMYAFIDILINSDKFGRSEMENARVPYINAEQWRTI